MPSDSYNVIEDTEKLQSISLQELDDMYETDPKTAQETLTNIWEEAREFIEEAGFSVPRQTEAELNPQMEGPLNFQPIKQNKFDMKSNNVKISSGKDIDHPFFGENPTVFSKLVHEGVHSAQYKHIDNFIDRIASVPDPENKSEITDIDKHSLGNYNGLGDVYFWSALEAQAGDRIDKIADLTKEEYEKWDEKIEKYRAQLKAADLVQFFEEGGTPEQLRDNIVSRYQNNPELTTDLSEQEFLNEVDEVVGEYAELRRGIRQAKQTRDEVIERFEDSLYEELELRDIDSEEYDGNIDEVFTCLMEWCANRGLEDGEEIYEFAEYLNGYAKDSDDLPKVAKYVLDSALDSESEEGEIREIQNIQEEVVVEGKYVAE